MKTFSTIFITGTIIGSIMIMGNEPDFNRGLSEVDPSFELTEVNATEEDIFDSELDIDFDKLFPPEPEMELSLDQIEYLELDEEIQLDFSAEMNEPEFHINYDQLFPVEDEIILTLDEIEYLEIEDEEILL
ncbi:hypothetical protein [Ulvibacterium sp.]|uniref:hypothetical protein n=1 Tax=Ulvibacterium sp. TaxID=2665914 RepID=UPI002627A71E|nr:hypothetical protein [Ulvibacterium sp.]